MFCFAVNGLAKKWGVPSVSLHFTLDLFAQHASYTPHGYSNYATRGLSFPSRMANYFTGVSTELMIKLMKFWFFRHLAEYNFDMDSPPQLVIVISEFGMVPAMDLPPFVKVVGPTVQSHRYISDPNIDLIVSSAENKNHSVIYISFGTVAFLPEDRVTIFTNALRRLENVTIIWAITRENNRKMVPTDLPEFIHIHGHVPQLQLLNHPAVKVFVSHCGANSAAEASLHGVPVLAVPLFGDQLRFAQQLQDLQMAEIAQFKNFSEDEIFDKLRRLLENPEYKNSAEKVRRFFKSSGGTAEAAWHIERAAYVGVHEYFVPERFNVNWFVRNHIDIWLNILLIGFILYKLFAWCCRCGCCQNKTNKK